MRQSSREPDSIGYTALNKGNVNGYVMAMRANATMVEVNASHVAYMSHPKETAKLIEEAAAGAKE